MMLLLIQTSKAGDIRQCLNRAEGLFGIDERLLIAIAKVESGFNPYAIGAGFGKSRWKFMKVLKQLKKEGIKCEGKVLNGIKGRFYHVSIKPRTKKEFLKALRIVKNYSHTYDIGLMQINSQHLKALRMAGIREIDLANPCQSVYVGAWILRQCVDRFGISWKAVDCYNKGRDAYSNSYYVRKVKYELRRMGW